MNKRAILRRLALFGLACGLVVSQATAAHAIEMVLQAQLIGKGPMSGKVQYVMYDKQVQTFSAFIQGANPGHVFVVAVRRPEMKSFAYKLGWFLPDKAGRGVVDLNTKFHPMPYLQAGDVIEVWYSNMKVMYGTLQ